MNKLANTVVAITGAGSGIGQELAIQLAEKGCHLALSDINETGLAETQNKAAAYGTKITTTVLDVRNREGVFEWADQVVADHGRVNVIINNAGVALSDTIDDMSFNDFEWLMDICFWGVVNGTKAFLPHLKAAEEGHIVNISSIFGTIAVPSQAAYNSAKFAIKGFTEALIMEMKLSDEQIHVTSVHPGGIRTNLVANARLPQHKQANESDDTEYADTTAAHELFTKLVRTSATQAANKIIKGIEKNKRRVLIGNDAWVLDKIHRIAPQGYQWLFETLAKSHWKKNKGFIPKD